MAIKVEHTARSYQVLLPESYHKIDNIRIRNNVVEYDILIFATQNARVNLAQPIDTLSNGIALDQLDNYTGDNIVAKLYDYTKTVFPPYVGKAVENV